MNIVEVNHQRSIELRADLEAFTIQLRLLTSTGRCLGLANLDMDDALQLAEGLRSVLTEMEQTLNPHPQPRKDQSHG